MLRNVSFSNSENVLQKNLRRERVRECIFRAYGGTILKMYSFGTNHDGAFIDLMYVPLAKKLSICPWHSTIKKNWQWCHVGKLWNYHNCSSLCNPEQSRSPIPDGWSAKLTFSSIVAFYLTKTENKPKKSQTQFSYCFE